MVNYELCPHSHAQPVQMMVNFRMPDMYKALQYEDIDTARAHVDNKTTKVAKRAIILYCLECNSVVIREVAAYIYEPIVKEPQVKT